MRPAPRPDDLDGPVAFSLKRALSAPIDTLDAVPASLHRFRDWTRPMADAMIGPSLAGIASGGVDSRAFCWSTMSTLKAALRGFVPSTGEAARSGLVAPKRAPRPQARLAAPGPSSAAGVGVGQSAGPMRRLRRAELPADTKTLAQYLIGRILVHDRPEGRLAGRIVETEAYVIGDAAGHAFRGETKRNRALFLDRGHAYVYFVYGCWYALNVSGERAGVGAGVLLRALEPLAGIATMRRLRGVDRDIDLARGPGRLAAAMDVDRRLDGVDLCGGGPLWIGVTRQAPGAIGRSVRIGISREVHRKLRFFERDNAFVSGPKRLRA